MWPWKRRISFERIGCLPKYDKGGAHRKRNSSIMHVCDDLGFNTWTKLRYNLIVRWILSFMSTKDDILKRNTWSVNRKVRIHFKIIFTMFVTWPWIIVSSVWNVIFINLWILHHWLLASTSFNPYLPECAKVRNFNEI